MQPKCLIKYFGRFYFHVLLTFLLPYLVHAQMNEESVITGHWQGAFITHNSQQPVQINFYQEEGQWKCSQVMVEWHPEFGEFEQGVEWDSISRLGFNTGYGAASLILDAENLEMIGAIEGSDPSISLHLKKLAPPPPPDYTVTEVRIPNKGIELYGHIHAPKFRPFKSAIILVGGRGCGAGNTQYNLYGKILRSYGIAVLAFHKRGNGNSGGDCNNATIDDLASDLQACRRYLLENIPGLENIGVLGNSAGGWVMLRAQEIQPFDFLIGIVAPSTSVFDQQMQSMQYGFDVFGLKPEAKEPLLEYTRMMFEARPNKRKFKRFQELLDLAEHQDWKKLLEDTDIPSNEKAIEYLWVRRHAYDPGPMLEEINIPYLAIYGEKDWVVPYKENTERLKSVFDGKRPELLTTVVAPGAQHGMEVDSKKIELAGGNMYWRFFRISPYVTTALIDFLTAHNFIGD